ncbi:NmrA family NAD(P)-binding protein [Rhizobium wenxiniae]|uniref:NmrA family NAD(P)-binding protein n=1 Tax=Rhizobium wenxiniae TaxID=1737357 RepID=UPI003C1BA46D
MKRTILITGATGSTGKAAVRLLLDKGFSVRAFVHKDDERSRKLASDGAEVTVGDLLDFRAVQQALDGVHRAYFVYPIRPGLAQASVQFAQAAREAGLEFIVNMSQKSARPEAKSNAALQHWLSEQVFNWAGTPVAHLRPTYFAEWLLYMRSMIREGRMSVPFGETGRHAPVAAEDQAAVIAAILADPTNHGGKVYPLFGPVEFTSPEIAAIIGQTLGKEVRYEKITATQWAREVTGQDTPFLAQHLDEVSIDHNDGVFAGTNDVIETIGGRSPMTVAQFVEKHRAVFE